eukprot:12932301-Prorocentrum_lima.AAC.1
MCRVQVVAVSLAASSAIPMDVLLCVGVDAFISYKLAGVCGRQPPIASIERVDALPLEIRRVARAQARG